MQVHCKIFKPNLNIQRNKWDSAFIAHNSPVQFWSLQLTPVEQFGGYSSKAFLIISTQISGYFFLLYSLSYRIICFLQSELPLSQLDGSYHS